MCVRSALFAKPPVRMVQRLDALGKGTQFQIAPNAAGKVFIQPRTKVLTTHPRCRGGWRFAIAPPWWDTPA